MGFVCNGGDPFLSHQCLASPVHIKNSVSKLRPDMSGVSINIPQTELIHPFFINRGLCLLCLATTLKGDRSCRVLCPIWQKNAIMNKDVLLLNYCFFYYYYCADLFAQMTDLHVNLRSEQFISLQSNAWLLCFYFALWSVCRECLLFFNSWNVCYHVTETKCLF